MIDFETFDAERFETQYEICLSAIEAWRERGEAFTMKDVARKSGHDVGELFAYFPNREAMLEFFYTSLVVRYRVMIAEIDDFEDYTLEEKLSNVAFATFDMLSEQGPFVQETFNDLILCRVSPSEYSEQLETLFREIFEEDDFIPAANRWVLNSVTYRLMTMQFLGLIRFWLEDETDDKQQTLELTDKATALLQEVMYNAAADRGIELLKFLYANSFFIDRLPVIREIRSKFEIR